MLSRWEKRHNAETLAFRESQDAYLAKLPRDQQKEAFFTYKDLLSAIPTAPEISPNRGPTDPWGFGEELCARFPALRQRNFYVVQMHASTAFHYDLRLQCSEGHPVGRPCDICGGAIHPLDKTSPTAHPRSPGTLSFAIPKGLSDFKESKHRMAVETELHSIHYSTYEGGGIGSTLVYDIGTYKVVQPCGSKEDRAADTTDEESSDDEPGLRGGKLGIRHERALAKAYKGTRDKSAFSVELRGLRYNMIITMSLDKASGTQLKYVRQKWHKHLTLRRQWICQIARPLTAGAAKLNREDKSLGERSVISGVTMAELKSAAAPSLNLNEVYEGGLDLDILKERQSRPQYLKTLARYGGPSAVKPFDHASLAQEEDDRGIGSDDEGERDIVA